MLLPALPLEAVLSNPELAGRYGVLGTLLLTLAEGGSLPQDVPVALLQRHEAVLGPLPLADVEAARPWLHDGAAKALFHAPTDAAGDEAALAELGALPRDRVGVLLTVPPASSASAADADAVAPLAARVAALCAGASTVVVKVEEGAAKEDEAALVAWGKALHQATKPKGGAPPRELLLWAPGLAQGWTTAGIHGLHASDVHVVLPADDAAGPSPEAPLPLAAPQEGGGGDVADAVDAFIACLRTDRPDGLYTTVVVDECNVALGLVYSSAGSIKASVAEGRGIYYSRSRGGLWRKGDSSGAVQELVRLDFDCDSDALRFVVRQRGDPPAFCHLNRRNCWREDRGLGALQRTLEARKASAPEGSYTKRLFDDPALLRNKLVEEAQELSEATEKEDVAAEAADVLYFAMVRCVAAGVGIEDIERHLDARSLKLARRPGNAKAHRIEAAQAILSGGGNGGEGK